MEILFENSYNFRIYIELLYNDLFIYCCGVEIQRYRVGQCVASIVILDLGEHSKKTFHG